MSKSYAKRNYEQVRVASLIAGASRRDAEREAAELAATEAQRPDGMTLDQEMVARAKVAKLAMENGVITFEQYRAKIEALKEEYKTRKAAA